jgi:hypothetical protein
MGDSLPVDQDDVGTPLEGLVGFDDLRRLPEGEQAEDVGEFHLGHDARAFHHDFGPGARHDNCDEQRPPGSKEASPPATADGGEIGHAASTRAPSSFWSSRARLGSNSQK